MLVAELDRLTARERRQVRGKLFGARHHRTVHQHRHDTDISGERRRSFDADKVLGIVQPALARAIGGEPSAADDDDQHFAGRYGAFERFDEVEAGLDAFDVHEHALGAEVADQPIVEATGVAGSILPSIADEYAFHRWRF